MNKSTAERFVCAACGVIKTSRYAFRVHQGLKHNADLQLVHQPDGHMLDTL